MSLTIEKLLPQSDVLRELVPPPLTPLPIDPLLPELVERLRAHGAAVLHAPTGAGKTTRVPPALAAAWSGDVIVLEPRRLAARAAAARMAYWRPLRTVR